MKPAIEEAEDLPWPVTHGECVVLIAASIAALIGTGALAAWILSNLVSFG